MQMAENVILLCENCNFFKEKKNYSFFLVLNTKKKRDNITKKKHVIMEMCW